MEYRDMNIQLNKGKSIGKVLYIVEGGKTEPYLLHRIFCNLLDYQLETILRDKGYRKYNSKENATSQVFVINAEESNLQFMDKDNKFLDKVFAELIEHYDFDVDNAAIYYIFDRDSESNTDTEFIRSLLSELVNSRDNGIARQGMLLLSYPSIEAFTFSNFADESFLHGFETGNALKQYLHECKINHSRISEETLLHAVEELMNAMESMDLGVWDVDAFGPVNMRIFETEENGYERAKVYYALSLLCISLIDLGIIEVEDD